MWMEISKLNVSIAILEQKVFVIVFEIHIQYL